MNGAMNNVDTKMEWDYLESQSIPEFLIFYAPLMARLWIWYGYGYGYGYGFGYGYGIVYSYDHCFGNASPRPPLTSYDLIFLKFD